jgi:K+-transporting ATPase c subunit
MATINAMGLIPLSEGYGSATAGQVVTAATPNIGGDTIPLQGSYTFLRFQTTGTASVVTLDSVELSNFGSDVNVTVSPTATQIVKVAIKNDPRFKQVSGNVGNLNLSYTSVTGMSLEAEYLA